MTSDNVIQIRQNLTELYVFPVPSHDGMWRLEIRGVDPEVLPVFARMVNELDELHNRDEARGAALAINLAISFVLDTWHEVGKDD